MTVSLRWLDRRWLRLIALWLLTALCAGCTGREEGVANRLVLLTPGGGMRPAVEAAVAEFRRENPGVEVKVVTAPGQDYYKKSLTMLAGRAPLDVLWLGQGFGMLAGRGALRDLQPFLEADPGFRLGDYDAGMLGGYRYGGKLYGLPYGVQVLVIAYNIDLFERAGVPLPSPDWTLEEMLAKARTLTRAGDGGRVIGLGFADLDYRYYGLSLLDAEESRFALNTETGRRWLERNIGLIYGDRVLRRGSDVESLDSLTGFLNGKVAMSNAATWDIPSLRQNARFRWDVVAVPAGWQGGHSAWASSSGFSVARFSRRPELAWKLLKKLTGPSFQRKMLTTSIPTLSALRQEYLGANPPPPRHLSEALRTLGFIQPNPRLPAFAEVDAEWNYWKDLALLRKITPREALRHAETEINRILRSSRKEDGP